MDVETDLAITTGAGGDGDASDCSSLVAMHNSLTSSFSATGESMGKGSSTSTSSAFVVDVSSPSASDSVIPSADVDRTMLLSPSSSKRLKESILSDSLFRFRCGAVSDELRLKLVRAPLLSRGRSPLGTSALDSSRGDEFLSKTNKPGTFLGYSI